MYVFYLDKIPLPVTPSSITTTIKNKNKTVDLINGSETTFLNLPGLTEINFECLIPHMKYPFSIYSGGYFQPPKYYLELFEKLKTERKGFVFYIMRVNDLADGNAHNTAMTVTLEDCRYTESATSGDDFTVTVKLKQYNHQSTKFVTVYDDGTAIIAEDATGRVIDDFEAPKVYTVKDGDTLWEIAKVYLGDGELWETLYNKNYYIIETAAIKAGYGDSFGGNLIIPGTVIAL